MAHSIGGMTDEDMVQWLRDISGHDQRHPAHIVAERLDQLSKMRHRPIELTAEVKEAVAQGAQSYPRQDDTWTPFEAEYRICMVGNYESFADAQHGLSCELEKHIRSMTK